MGRGFVPIQTPRAKSERFLTKYQIPLLLGALALTWFIEPRMIVPLLVVYLALCAL